MEILITQDDIKLLKSQSRETLAKWFNSLNSWEWPENLPGEERACYIENGRRSQIMTWINNEVGLKYILRLHNSDMPEDIFEDFWRGNHEKDSEANKRYLKWMRGRLKK